MRKIFFYLFLLYCLAVAEILLIGRKISDSVPVADYFILYANIIPFETLIRYVAFFAGRRDIDSFRLAFFNLGGNFLLFLPMGFFLPVLFSDMTKRNRCLFAVFCTVLTAELLQGIFRVGIPDIDDLTVNLLGAYVGFSLFKKAEKAGAF